MNLDITDEEAQLLKMELKALHMFHDDDDRSKRTYKPEVSEILIRLVPASAIGFGEKGLWFQRGALRLIRELLKAWPDPPDADDDPDFPQKPSLTKPAPVEATTLQDQVLSVLPAPTGTIEWIVATEKAGALAIKTGGKDHHEARQAFIERLCGPDKFWLPRAELHHIEHLEDMVTSFPNFSEVIESLVEDVALQMATGEPLHIAPLLLLGGPGVGKTMFAFAVARALGFSVHHRSLAETSAGFVLNGANGRWSDGYPGAIATAIAETPRGQAPLIVLDELDKSRTLDHSPSKVLYGLLEPESAQRWRDEYVDLEMDIRPVSFVLTANDLQSIDSAIVSRLQVVNVPSPTLKQMPAVVRSVDAVLRSEVERMDAAFAPLSSEMVANLAVMSPRVIRRKLKRAYARCARRSPDATTVRELTLTDVM